jgi:hypothetical protein
MGDSMGVMAEDASMLEDILNDPGPPTAISMLRPVMEISTPCFVGVKWRGAGGGGNAKQYAVMTRKSKNQRTAA